jgi:hypothetical protein
MVIAAAAASTASNDLEKRPRTASKIVFSRLLLHTYYRMNGNSSSLNSLERPRTTSKIVFRGCYYIRITVMNDNSSSSLNSLERPRTTSIFPLFEFGGLFQWLSSQTNRQTDRQYISCYYYSHSHHHHHHLLIAMK